MSLQQLALMISCDPVKKISNWLTLQPRKLKIHQIVPRFCPGENFFILTLCTLRPWLEWPLISVSTSQPMHEMCSGPSKKKICHRFTTKLLIAEILERCLLVAKKVPYNSQMTLHENCRPFVPQTDDLCFSPPTATYSNGHSSENGQRGIFFIFVKPSQIDWDPHANFWVKILNIQRSRISPTFRYVQKSQKVDT